MALKRRNSSILQHTPRERHSLDTARQYIVRGWRPIPVPHGQKKPEIQGWPSLLITDDNAHEYFNGQPQNIGIILGKPSQGLVDVDLDSGEARKLADLFLPATGSVFGRHSSPRSHWLYYSTETRSSDFQDPCPPTEGGARTVLLEIRGEGHQTVFPGSVHTSGERVEWAKDAEAREPARVAPDDLYAACAKLAAASLLARHWPSQGSRQDTAMALSGALLLGGWEFEVAEEFLRAVVEVGGDDESRERLTCLRSTQKSIEQGERVTGLPRLEQLLPSEVVRRVAEWLELKRDLCPPEVARLNQKHAVVREGGKTSVITEDWDDCLGRHVLERSSVRDFEHFYMNELVQVGETRDGRPKYEPLGRHWMCSRHRRTYKAIVFRPGEETSPEEFNLWRGWPVTPKEGDWSLLKQHILENVCQGRRDLYEYNLNWFARAVQFPGQQAETALVYRGPQGAGKGLVARSLGHLFGQHFLHISQPKHLVGNFNAHLRDVIVLFCDEAFWAGDKKGESTLKQLITEPMLAIEPKGRDVIVVRNTLHVIMASNSDWVVPANLDERRFAVLDVSATRAQDTHYFGAIVHQMENGGYEAMLYDLLHRDISKVDLRRVPETGALREQKIQSMEPHVQWWFHKLETGSLLSPCTESPDGIEWEDGKGAAVPCGWLHDDYVKAVGKVGVMRRATETELALRFKKLVPNGGPKKGRQSVTVAFLGVDGPSEKSERHYTWAFPPLAECRKHFDVLTRSEWDWPEVERDNY